MSTTNNQPSTDATRTSGRVRRPTTKAAESAVLTVSASRKRTARDSNTNEDEDSEAPADDIETPRPLEAASSAATIITVDDDDDGEPVPNAVQKFNKLFGVEKRTNEEVLGELLPVYSL